MRCVDIRANDYSEREEIPHDTAQDQGRLKSLSLNKLKKSECIP
jgi:hypothetical protein